MTLILTATQAVDATIQPIDVNGNPAPVDGIPVWSSSAPDVLTITPDENGLSALILTTGATGTAQISVTADADLGEGIETITALADVQVVAGRAVGISLTFGVPYERS